MKFDFDEARKQVLYKTEMFGRNVAMIIGKEEKSADELAAECQNIPVRYVQLLVEGQPPYPMRSGWRQEIVGALGRHANRGEPEDLSDDECDLLVQSECPWQNETPPDGPDQGTLL
jgi:hypothetical protein